MSNSPTIKTPSIVNVRRYNFIGILLLTPPQVSSGKCVVSGRTIKKNHKVVCFVEATKYIFATD